MQDLNDAATILQEGGVGVLPTDTLYGLVGSALMPDTIERIYKLKERNSQKPLIVLISDIEQLEQFGIELSEVLTEQLAAYWPQSSRVPERDAPRDELGAYSIILPTLDDQFEYLSCNTDTIAFRLPDNDELRELIRVIGPIVAPSANPEGFPPATTIDAARKYFGTDVDFYVDGGALTGKPSTILAFDDDEIKVVRE
jgi:L-threonylcarbamoyladenylate synthase